MRISYTYFFVFCLSLLTLTACVETAKPSKRQVIRLYTDFPKTFDKNSFRQFGRKEHIEVLLYYKTSAEIIEQIQTKKWNCGIDLVVLRNPVDLVRLKNMKALYRNKEDSTFYQGLLIDPYVFEFPNDTLPLYSSYGQLFRNNRIKIDPSAIRSPREWQNLVGGLVQKYPKISPQAIYNKVMRTDSLRGKDVKVMRIVPYSKASDKKKITFPDKYYKGSVGKIAGVAIIRQAKYSYNAQLLYKYCQQNWWRKKLAKKMGLFPMYLTDNQNVTPYLYQGMIENYRFLKKVDF